MRRRIVAGNWKMNLGYSQGMKLVDAVKEAVGEIDDSDKEVIFCPSFIHLTGVGEKVKNFDGFYVGAQNVSEIESGAFTGEVSAEMLASIDMDYVIIGHSERRALYGEDDLQLADKVTHALDNDLKIIFCVGENLQEREANQHYQVVERQMEDGFLAIGEAALENIVVAYEPVWAIGTGRTASPEQAQEMHRFIRQTVATNYGFNVADDMTILYGGSVKSNNAAELFACPDVDGGLIGGAALDVASFVNIIKAI